MYRAALGLLGAVWVTACSPSAGTDPGSGQDGVGAGDTAAGGADTAGGGSSVGIGDGEGLLSDGTESRDPMAPEDLEGACAAIEQQAETIEVEVEVEVPVRVESDVPVAIYLMLDRSGSMDDGWSQIFQNLLGGWFGGGGGGPTRWESAVDAIKTFVADPESHGTKVALQYFPIDHGECNGAGYNDPAVPMGELPGNAAAINASLDATSPGGGTPMEGALEGLTQFCRAYKATNPEDRCVGVLITDGAPFGCNTSNSHLASIARQAFDSDGIVTFAVGMEGASFENLNMIAEGGQGDCNPALPGFQACDVTEKPEDFLEALRLIRRMVTFETVTETRTEVQSAPLPCEWTIPEPPEGETFDPDLVNLRFRTSDGIEQSLGRVPSAADCASFDGGWYYDDPGAPERIHVCESTCNVIANFPNARMDVLFGCKYVPSVPR